jgi:hypothetical protein
MLPDQNPQVTFTHLPSINFALQQNYVPVVREAAKIFGYARIGANVESAIVTGIEYAISRGMAHREKDRVVLR